MDAKELIESGLLERHVMGELSPSEAQMVEQALLKHQEVKTHYAQLEADLETMAQENAIEPPRMVKQKLMETIAEDHPDVIPMPARNRDRSYLAIAATLALALGIVAFWMYQKVATLRIELDQVVSQKEVLSDELENLITEYDETSKWYQAINDPNAIQLVLQGNQKAPDAWAVSYVNHADQSVVLNAGGLPELSAEEDYQLWADVDGEMIDMGVIPKQTRMIAMNYIENAESLNITIEPAGGSDHPTVENLISNVYLNP